MEEPGCSHGSSVSEMRVVCIIGEATTLSSTTLVEVSLLILVVVIFVAPSSVGKTLESRQRSSDTCVSRLPCGVKNTVLSLCWCWSVIVCVLTH